jgi:hypothetical protein
MPRNPVIMRLEAKMKLVHAYIILVGIIAAFLGWLTF